MISPNAWWAVLQNYSRSVFPAQGILYLLSVAVAVLFLTRADDRADRLIKGFFVLAFGWIGIVFFGVLGQALPAHNAQVFLFLSLASLFAVDLATGTSSFRLPQPGGQRTATLVALALVLAYPLFSLLQGRPPARWIIPGAYPCPTTALALVLMSTARPDRRRWLYFAALGLLLLWAIPFPIMIQIPQFGVYEDGIMLATGLFTLVTLLVNRRRTPGMERRAAIGP